MMLTFDFNGVKRRCKYLWKGPGQTHVILMRGKTYLVFGFQIGLED